jgi:transposase
MKPKTKTTASLAVVGVDIGKEVFHLVGLGTDGTIAFRRKIRRLSLKDVFEQLPPCVVGMEACLSAHFVSRTLRALGHEPRIIPAIYTKPFVKGQKNDEASPNWWTPLLSSAGSRKVSNGPRTASIHR